MHFSFPRRLLFLILIFTFGVIYSRFTTSRSYVLADDPNALQQQIDQLSKQIADLETSMAPLKKESTGLQAKITSAKSQIATMENQAADLDKKIIDRQADLQVQQTLLSERVRNYYINSKKFNPFLIFFSSAQSVSLIRQFTWFQAIISRDRTAIVAFTNDINSLNDNKTKLQAEKVKLAALKKSMEDRFGFLANEIGKAEKYKAELSAKQQQLIAEKTAMFNTSVGDVSSSDDPASRADYNPGFSPAFAAFSFGAPHRKGMSQYGAYGRAKAGQGYEQILKAYYGDVRVDKVNTDGSIKTDQGTLPFEDNYLVGIAEMPADWGDKGGYEALKAQAIAARTYALNSTNNLAGSICTNENCQVYSKSRLNSPGRWKQAVQDTRGMVLKSNSTGNIFSSMYASTSGGATIAYSSNGYNSPQVWDTPCGNQGCWPNDSYEKQAGSPWYYKGWYKTRSGTSAGRNHPWLSQAEFSDIINAVLYNSKTNDSSHLSQTQNCLGSCDSNAWSQDELRRQVGDKGGPISSINSINVSYSTSGVTKNVHVSTDKGDFDFDATLFKDTFNLRSPGAIALKSGLFNIEKK